MTGGPLTVTHFAVGMDDAVCLLRSEILEVGALLSLRHGGRATRTGTRADKAVEGYGKQVQVRAEGRRGSCRDRLPVPPVGEVGLHRSGRGWREIKRGGCFAIDNWEDGVSRVLGKSRKSRLDECLS